MNVLSVIGRSQHMHCFDLYKISQLGSRKHVSYKCDFSDFKTNTMRLPIIKGKVADGSTRPEAS